MDDKLKIANRTKRNLICYAEYGSDIDNEELLRDLSGPGPAEHPIPIVIIDSLSIMPIGCYENWIQSIYGNSKDGTLTVLLFDRDSVINQGWWHEIYINGPLKRQVYKKNDLDKINWTIVY